MTRCQHCYGSGVAPDWKRLGKELRERRIASCSSIRDVARKAGCSAAHVCDMEQGKRTVGGEKAANVLVLFDLCPEHAFDMPFETWEPIYVL